MDAVLFPLRQLGIHILNHLDDWLILALSEDELLSHRSVLLSHLECLGLRVNFAKSALSPSQQISFLGTVIDSARMRAVLTPEHALVIQQLVASFKLGVPHPLKAFQRMLGLMASASSVLQLGLLHMWSLQYWLKLWVPPHAWRHGCLCVTVSQACIAALAPWLEPSIDGTGRAPGLGLQKAGGLNRRLQLRLGECCSISGRYPSASGRNNYCYLHINCLEMLAVGLGLSARPEGTSCLSPLRQYDGGVPHKSSGWSFLEAPLYSSWAPLKVGSAQLVLAESNAYAGQTEPGSRHAISEQCPLRQVDAPPTNGSQNMGNLQLARSRPLRLRRQHSLPNSLCRYALAHDWPNILLYALCLRTLQCYAAARLSRFSRSNLRSLGDCPHYIAICPTHSGGFSSHRLCSAAATIGLFVTKGRAVTLRY